MRFNASILFICLFLYGCGSENPSLSDYENQYANAPKNAKEDVENNWVKHSLTLIEQAPDAKTLGHLKPLRFTPKVSLAFTIRAITLTSSFEDIENLDGNAREAFKNLPEKDPETIYRNKVQQVLGCTIAKTESIPELQKIKKYISADDTGPEYKLASLRLTQLLVKEYTLDQLCKAIKYLDSPEQKKSCLERMISKVETTADARKVHDALDKGIDRETMEILEKRWDQVASNEITAANDLLKIRNLASNARPGSPVEKEILQKLQSLYLEHKVDASINMTLPNFPAPPH